jgi:hypothetical protein
MVGILIFCTLTICLFGGYVDLRDQPWKGLGKERTKQTEHA